VLCDWTYISAADSGGLCLLVTGLHFRNEKVKHSLNGTKFYCKPNITPEK